MTQASARVAANVILASAGAAAAYIIVTTPALRRLTLRALSLWLGASIPAYLMNQTTGAWHESARRR
jgi:hypothetical protein